MKNFNKFVESDFVKCIQTIQNSGVGDVNPTEFPQEGIVYPLLDVAVHDEYPDECFLVLEGLEELHWNSVFFIPVDKIQVSDLVTNEVTPEIERDTFRKVMTDDA